VNAVDLLIAAAVVLAIVTGIRAGFIKTLYGLITWIVSIPAAFALQGPLGSLVAIAGATSTVARMIAFVGALIVINVGLMVVGSLAVYPFVDRIHRDRALGIVDRALGVLPSVLRMLVITAIALAAALVLPIGSDARSAIDRSGAAQALIAQVSLVRPIMGGLTAQDPNEPIVVTKLGADQSERLDLPNDLALAPDPDAEQEMLRLLNQERTSRGLAALELAPRALPVARQHSEEMFRLKYFGHQSPVLGSPFDRLQAAKISYTRAGENLAYAPSVSIAHRGLMESQGHRENILRPEFTHVAIGVISGGAYGRMFTQLFITP
jgi:uncharacterized protein YkwD/uncharacterized membrane protein required for colicin V production